jgi:hypothetical protein
VGTYDAAIAAAAQQAALAALEAQQTFLYTDIPFGTSVEHVFTLDSFMSQWAWNVADEPASLAGADVMSEALAVAQDRCATIGTSDCSQAQAIAQRWGAAAAPFVTAWRAAQPAPTQAPRVQGLAPTVSVAPAAAAVPPSPAAAQPSTGAAPALSVPAPGTMPTTPAGSYGLQTIQARPALISTLAPIALGNPIVFGIISVVSIVGSLFGSLFGGPDVSKLAQAVNDLRNALASATDQLYRFSWSVAFGLGKFLGAFHDIWDTFIDGVWSILKNIVKAVWHVMTEALPKVAEAVAKTRKLIDQIYEKYARPVLNYIQQVRKYLAILRALHVPFAGKLDQILAGIEGKIAAPFLYVLRQVNGIGNWVNVIITARATLQRALMINSLFENAGALVNIFWSKQTAKAPSSAGAGAGAAAPPQGQAQAIAELQLYAQTGSGPLAFTVGPAIAELRSSVGV